jgi:cell surface protein SprA
VEVWVTNRLGIVPDFQNATGYRDVVAFMDMGERDPYNKILLTGSGDSMPRNNANDLFNVLSTNPNTRNSSLVQQTLTGLGFQPVQDFEKTFARKLQPSEYYFNPQIGFISLNQPLQPDEVVGVAYQYTSNGRIYQVGEFSQDIPPDSSGNTQKVLFLKLLKATSQRTNLPIWDLMMKNVYSVGFGQLERNDFRLDVTYEEPSAGDKRYLPPTNVLPQYKGIPIIQLDNLDRLNNQNDPQPDGLFDYIEGFTVISSQSRIIFPVLEPFGHDLDYVYPSQAEAEKYLFYPLYDTIKALAQNYTNLDRFKLVGRSKSAVNSEYQLGFNIPRGSVSVTAGGRILQENIDYEINYDLGTLRITNPAIIQSGLPVQVQFENNATFGLQQRNYLGLRLDYLVNRHLTVGGTMVRLSERPFFTKQGYGEDPIRNTMYGTDFDYRNDFPRMTKWLNKLPFYSTKAMSSITAYGEAAMLKPGHAPQIGEGRDGVIYIDDFEGTRSTVDLRFPLISWTLASTPQNSPDKDNNILFPEATLNNNLASGYNRAKLAWYNIEPVLQERKNSNNPLRNDPAELSRPETRQVLSTEIFPQRTNDLGQNLLTTFDLAYYPQERGPYNFRTSDLNPSNGALMTPRKSWGGIMRSIDQTDFETSNI